MPVNVSIDDYCKNPSDYANTPGLDDDTKKYWSSLCALRKEASKQEMSKRHDLANAFPQAAGEMIQMLTSPTSLEILGGVAGGKIFFGQIKKALSRFIENGPDKAATEAAEEAIENGADPAVVNGSIIQDGITSDLRVADVGGDLAVDEGVDFAGRGAAEFAIDAMEVLGEVGSGLEGAFMVIIELQILGMVLDAWDPCHLNSQLDAKLLKMFSESFNTNFRDSVMIANNSVEDSYGHIMFSDNYPVEYFADQSVLLLPKKDYYNKITNSLVIKYIMALEYNSNGQRIKYQTDGRLITKHDINKIEVEFSLGLSDQNTVVANWLYRWWPIITVFIVLIIILFLFIKNRQK